MTSTLFFAAQSATCLRIASVPPGTQWSQRLILSLPAAPAVRMCTNGRGSRSCQLHSTAARHTARFSTWTNTPCAAAIASLPSFYCRVFTGKARFEAACGRLVPTADRRSTTRVRFALSAIMVAEARKLCGVRRENSECPSTPLMSGYPAAQVRKDGVGSECLTAVVARAADILHVWVSGSLSGSACAYLGRSTPLAAEGTNVRFALSDIRQQTDGSRPVRAQGGRCSITRPLWEADVRRDCRVSLIDRRYNHNTALADSRLRVTEFSRTLHETSRLTLRECGHPRLADLGQTRPPAPFGSSDRSAVHSPYRLVRAVRRQAFGQPRLPRTGRHFGSDTHSS